MGVKQYVQHKSGEGETFFVTDETYVSWRIKTPPDSSILFYDVPKSEYRLCEPPEKWRDVSEQCELAQDSSNVQCVYHDGATRFVTAWNGPGYRLRKVLISVGSPQEGLSTWAFIVERKVQP